MKTSLLAILLTIFSFTSVIADNASFLTGEPAPGIENSTLRDISSDASGNSYVTGTVITEGYSEIFIAKYDAAGNLQWIKAGNGGGHYGNNSYSISVDAQGNAYITGTFSGVAEFGTESLRSQGVANMFIAKYDANGNLAWVKQAKGNDYESQVHGKEITFDGNHLVVTGTIANEGDFGTQQVSGTGNYEAYYTSAGELVSVKLIQ